MFYLADVSNNRFGAAAITTKWGTTWTGEDF
jgi:hypothetical protein